MNYSGKNGLLFLFFQVNPIPFRKKTNRLTAFVYFSIWNMLLPNDQVCLIIVSFFFFSQSLLCCTSNLTQTHNHDARPAARFDRIVRSRPNR